MKYLSILLVLIISTLSISAQNVDESPVYLAYVSVQDWAASGYDLYVMDFETREILHTIATEAQDCPVGFSPDGRYLQFYQRSVSEGVLRHRVQLLDIASGKITELRYFAQGVWSSDSTRIAYSVPDRRNSSSGPYDIYIYDVTTGEEIYIGWKYHVTDMYWAWAGERLFFTGVDIANIQDNLRELYTWDGENIVSVLDDLFLEGIAFDEFSPNGSHALIRIKTESEDTFYSMDLNTYSETLLDFEYIMPLRTSWHPDGEQVIMENAGETIPQIDIRTGEIIRLRENVPITYGYQWSPDGRYLSYNQRLNDEAMMMQIEDTQTNNMIEVGLNLRTWAVDTAWLSDTQFVYNLILLDEEIGDLNDLPEISSELVFFDVATGGYGQLTDTPNQAELLECFLG